MQSIYIGRDMKKNLGVFRGKYRKTWNIYIIYIVEQCYVFTKCKARSKLLILYLSSIPQFQKKNK